MTPKQFIILYSGDFAQVHPSIFIKKFLWKVMGNTSWTSALGSRLVFKLIPRRATWQVRHYWEKEDAMVVMFTAFVAAVAATFFSFFFA